MNIKLYLKYLILGCLPCLGSSQMNTSLKIEDQQIDELLDSVVNKNMETLHVPGTSVVFIKDSQSFIKGYGIADIENGISVDPDRTGFRVASITKTLTSIAVLQLVEQGVLDLHADINQYLPDDMEHLFKKGRVTLHHLLTHTAGYDMTDINDAAVTLDGVKSIEEVIRNYMPAQVHPPGKVYSYSNFGFTLAGYVIEKISGIPYEEYIQENILDPLEMSFSSLKQPLPGQVKNNIAESYLWDGKQKRYERDFTQVVPADGLVTTGRDMTNYLQMLLNEGVFKGKTILTKSSFDSLTSQQYGARDSDFGICYAFFEGEQRGFRSLEHSGGQLGFASLIVIIPEVNTGIFITHNSREGANAFRYHVMGTILDTLLDEKDLAVEGDIKTINQHLNKYNGYYQQMNFPKSSFEKIGLLFGVMTSEWKIKNIDNVLIINGMEFSNLGDGVFKSKDYHNWKLAFEEDEGGLRVMSGLTSYKKIPWYKRNLISQILLMPALLFLLIMLLARPIKSLIRISNTQKEKPKRDWVYEWLYFTGSVFIISFLVILTGFMLYEGQLTDYGIPFTIKSSLVFNLIAGILSILSPIALYIVGTSIEYNRWRKVFYIVGIVSVIIVAIGFFQFNLMAI